MSRDWKRATASAAATALFASASVASLAETPPSGGPYRIDRSTIDAGGERSTGGRYVLTGTIGQADADRASGGGIALQGGFWATTPSASAPPQGDPLFANGFE